MKTYFFSAMLLIVNSGVLAATLYCVNKVYTGKERAMGSESNGTKLSLNWGRQSYKIDSYSNYGLAPMQLFLPPDFNIQSLRRKPNSAAQKIKALKSKIQSHQLTQIGAILESFIPASLFDEHRLKTSRRRIFSIENGFWGLFLQALQPDSL